MVHGGRGGGGVAGYLTVQTMILLLYYGIRNQCSSELSLEKIGNSLLLAMYDVYRTIEYDQSMLLVRSFNPPDLNQGINFKLCGLK